MYVCETIIFSFAKCNLVQGEHTQKYNTGQVHTFIQHSYKLRLYGKPLKTPEKAGAKLFNKLHKNAKSIEDSLERKLREY